MERLALPLVLLLSSAFGVLTASAQTTFTNGPSATFNGNHEAGCPVQITSQDGQAAPSGSSYVCFQASAFQNGSFCSTPTYTGYCLSLYFPFPVGDTSGIFESGVITYGPNQFTYCAPPTITGSNCGIGSTFTQVSQFNFWGQWTGTLVENFFRQNTYKVCSRYTCVAKYNDVITSGSGTMQPVQQ